MPTVNEMLAALNVDELSPLEALTKLHELKRAAAAERTAEAQTAGDGTVKQLRALIDGLYVVLMMSSDMNKHELEELCLWLTKFARRFDNIHAEIRNRRNEAYLR